MLVSLFCPARKRLMDRWLAIALPAALLSAGKNKVLNPDSKFLN